MNNRFDQGFFSYTATARPYWGGDVTVTSLRTAPSLRAGNSSLRLRNAVSKVLAAITKR